MPTIVFDLDGTLADTSADLIAAANACFAGRGWGKLLDPARDASTAFRGGRAMLRLGLERIGRGGDEECVEEEFPKALVHYANGIDKETTLYPGAIAALERLRLANYRTAICTNKPEGLAVELIARLGVSHLFDALIGADTLPVRKPDPAPYFRALADAGGTGAPSLLVGDTETDRETAIAAGVPCILVGFGPEGAGIGRLSPDALLDHYDDLDRVITPFLT